MQNTKACTKCKIVKPLDEYSLDKGNKDGRRYACRTCTNAAMSAYRRANPDKFKVYNKTKRERHGEVLNDKARAHRLNNLDEYREKSRQKTNKPEYKSYKQEYDRAYRASLLEKKKQNDREYYLKNREGILARVKQYAQDNREQTNKLANAAWNRRRAKIQANGGSYTAKEWEALKAHYDRRCLRCGKQEPEIKLTVDHVIPIEMGGLNVIGNLQPLCGSCNCAKGPRHIDYRPTATAVIAL